MLPEIWEPQLMVVFVGTAVAGLSDTLGFYHLHPRNRFWELLEIGGITPKRIITPQERKALADGHADGSLSDPVRSMFTQKKTSQMLQLGIGLTDLNRRVLASNDKDKSARPTQEDIEQFIVRDEKLNPTIVAFVTSPEIFVELFKSRYPGTSDTLGLQPFRINNSEVWLLGSTSRLVRGEALDRQEDAFCALGERISVLKGEAGDATTIAREHTPESGTR
jgi:G:T/U-mismatch repair DNA glycosylase